MVMTNFDERFLRWMTMCARRVFVICLLLFIIQCVQIQFASVPSDWSNLEKGRWYQLIEGFPNVFQVHCDPGAPGYMYGVADEENHRFLTFSTDAGRTWSADPGEVTTALGPLKDIRFFRVWFSADNQKVFWLIATISLWDGDYLFLLKRHALSEEWQVVLNCTQTFDLRYPEYLTQFAIGPDGKLFVMVLGNVWVSDDFGGTWRRTYSDGRGHPYDFIAFSPTLPGTVFISANYNLDCMLWRSNDNGETWNPTTFNISLPGVGAEGISGIRCHPTDPDTLFVFVSDIYNSSFQYSTKISTDGGMTWSDYGPPEIVKLNDIYFVDGKPNEVLLVGGSREHIVKSYDGGQTWEIKLSMSIMNPFLDSFILSPWDPNVLYCATKGVFESHDNGETWNRTCPLLKSNYLDHLGYIFTDDPMNMVFLEEESGAFWSNNGGSTWNPGFGYAGNKTRSGTLVTQDVSTHEIYTYAQKTVGGEIILASSDMGKTWRTLPFLPNSQPMYATSSNCVTHKLYAIYRDAGIDDSSHIMVSLDAGASWQAMDLPEDNYYVEVQDSPYDPDLVLVIGVCPEGDDLAEYFFRSEDGGVTFQKIGPENGMGNAPTYYPNGSIKSSGAFYFDPVDSNKIYGGYTDSYYSTDSGRTWNDCSINFNLKHYSVIQTGNPSMSFRKE